MAFRRAQKYPLDSSSLGRLLDGMTELKLEGLARGASVEHFPATFSDFCGAKGARKAGAFFSAFHTPELVPYCVS